MNTRTQGSSPERDTRTGSPTAVAVLERARRHHTVARETTHRRRQRLNYDLRRVEESERAEREAAAAMTRVEWVVGRSARARDAVAAATPRPPGASAACTLAVGTIGVPSRLGISFMASSARVEFSAELRTAVVAKASAPLTSVRRT